MVHIARVAQTFCVAVGLWVGLYTAPATAGDAILALGKRLFFDPGLSGSGQTACASCHDPRFGYAQPRRVAVSDNGQFGRRNALPLLDVRWQPRLMWDGRFPSLETQAFGPFSTSEMGNSIDEAVHRLSADPQYRHLFYAAFGEMPTPEGLARAIAAFERTIVSPMSRVDRFLVRHDPGALSPMERYGFDVFTRRAPCATCHQLFPTAYNGRPMFTDFQFHNIGVGPQMFHDLGRYEQTRNPADWGAFRTPSLRTSVRTPPYMHNGSLASLEEVVEFYNAGGRPRLNVSPLIRPLHLYGEEKAALVAFLRAMAN
jgi:cytochrome c peroxidase